MLRCTNCKARCTWHDFNPTDVSFFRTLYLAGYSSCSYSSSQRMNLTFTHNWVCQDSTNSYVPTAAYNTISAGTASTPTATVSATVTYKYTAKVAKDDTCIVKTCSIICASTTKSASCSQTVAKGSAQTFSAAFTLGKGTHSCKATTKAKSLPQ